MDRIFQLLKMVNSDSKKEKDYWLMFCFVRKIKTTYHQIFSRKTTSWSIFRIASYRRMAWKLLKLLRKENHKNPQKQLGKSPVF